ncbi:aspartyl-phosphate phosphatase Spo0E family protein [Alkalihalobacillus sp. BA299]|uniref:aspartyl-phosphate phosphatase Spo0E family protein n=1 Tax=Alkalihalobacillus sp. BA299 TaxID=2815938 RepID=UPI001AD9FBBA|nr:aspartyl-phosphate phosphatase Spo0E family protein [Alkalihalobacillus sp. BA299]
MENEPLAEKEVNMKDYHALKNDIERKRNQMHSLARIKGLNDSQVIKTSQELDRKISSFQLLVARVEAYYSFSIE